MRSYRFYTDKEVLNRFIPRARVVRMLNTFDRVVSLKKMASSRDQSRDSDKFMAASMQHERDTIECDFTDDDDEIMLAASQQYEASLQHERDTTVRY